MRTKKRMRYVVITFMLIAAVICTTAVAGAAKSSSSLKVGKTFKNGSYSYKVTALKGKTGTVSMTGAKSKSITKVTMPNTVKSGKYTFKVDSVANNAFKGYKKLTSFTASAELKSIGKNAFSGCVKLKTIKIGSPHLSKVGSNAFKGIDKKAVISIPGSLQAEYAKLLKGKGQKASVSVKADPAFEKNFKKTAKQTTASVKPAAPVHTHSYGAWHVTTPATCTQEGVETAACSCGDQKTRPVAALGHNMTVYPETPATCTNAGCTEYTACSRCGLRETEPQTIPAFGHTYGEWTETKAAGCTTAGTETKTCQTCGATQTRQIAAKGHSFAEWETEREAKCVIGGTEVRVCADCGAKERRTTAALPHTLVPVPDEDYPATCLQYGRKDSKRCTVCNNIFFDLEKPLGHEFGELITKEPTCTEDGGTYRECSRCKEREYVDRIAATGHVWGEPVYPETAPCTEPVYATHTCTLCGAQETVKGSYRAAAGHRYTDWEQTRPATCTRPGEKTKTCTLCGNQITDSIPALGHARYTHSAVKATCSHEGTSEYISCSRCGENLTTPTTTPKLAHQWSGSTEIQTFSASAGEEAAGGAASGCAMSMEYKTCALCGEKKVMEFTPGTGHRWIDTDNDGLEDECSVCHFSIQAYKSKQADGTYADNTSTKEQAEAARDAWVKWYQDWWKAEAEKSSNPEGILESQRASDKYTGELQKDFTHPRYVYSNLYVADADKCAGFGAEQTFNCLFNGGESYIACMKTMILWSGNGAARPNNPVLPTPAAKEGYTFKGWKLYGTDTIVSSLTYQDMGKTYVAVFE